MGWIPDGTPIECLTCFRAHVPRKDGVVYDHEPKPGFARTLRMDGPMYEDIALDITSAKAWDRFRETVDQAKRGLL